MKAEELMIGDWVCLADGNLPLEERYFKIEYLAISAGVSWVNQGTNAPIGLGDGESCIPVFRDEIYPIPITTEILEKNGFENQGFRYHDEYNGINDRVVLKNKREYINSDNEWRVLIESEDYHSIAHCELTYVHELQHILRLCKIDKEIII